MSKDMAKNDNTILIPMYLVAWARILLLQYPHSNEYHTVAILAEAIVQLAVSFVRSRKPKLFYRDYRDW